MARTNRKEVKRFVKFAMVGAAGTITDFVILNLLVQFAGFPLALANTVSFTTAVFQNFILNRYWTFPESRERHASGQLLQFAMVSAVGYALSQFVFLTLNHLWVSYWITEF